MTTKSKPLPAFAGLTWKTRPDAALWRRRAKGLAIPLSLIVLLEILVGIGWVPAYQMPAPSEILLTLRELAEGPLWTHIGASLARVLGGFAIGAGLALLVTLWVGLSREAEVYWNQPSPACGRSPAWPGCPCCCSGWASTKPPRWC